MEHIGAIEHYFCQQEDHQAALVSLKLSNLYDCALIPSKGVLRGRPLPIDPRRISRYQQVSAAVNGRHRVEGTNHRRSDDAFHYIVMKQPPTVS